MPWFGDGNLHRMDRYVSNNPTVIENQLNCMQATVVNGMRIEGVIMTWQGPLAGFQHSTTTQMAAQCAERGMLFALLLDPWCAKLGTGNATQNVTTALQNATTQTMLNSTAYLPEKYVLDFNTGANLATLATEFPTLKFLAQGAGFSWVSIDMAIPGSDARNAASVANLKNQNANAAMKIPGFGLGFNDAGMPTPSGVNLAKWTGTVDLTQSVWGGAPSRVLDTQGGNFFFDQWAVTPQTSEYGAIITWNDYDERTAIEDTCSMLSGIQI